MSEKLLHVLTRAVQLLAAVAFMVVPVLAFVRPGTAFVLLAWAYVAMEVAT